jgi:hypothetical protein
MRILLVLLACTQTAYAGLDCEEAATIKSIEAFAKSKQSPPGEYDWVCLQMASPALAPRIEAACTKILDRDGVAANPCVIAAAAAGFAKLGAHDLFAAVVELPEDPIESAGGVTLTKTIAFLEAQIKMTKDKAVARACRNAIAAIRKRNP